MWSLRDSLEPIAEFFRGLGIPEPIVHWGHPLMMGIVIFVMGSFVAIAGWQGRLSQDIDRAKTSRMSHRMLAPWMFLFLALGYTGGILSLVMQHQPILTSPHFVTGTGVLILLGLNGVFSLSGFWGDKPFLRNLHAYLGTLSMLVLFLHAALGLKLGLSI